MEIRVTPQEKLADRDEYHQFNPLTPRSDQYINSPYNCNTMSKRKVMRIEKIYN